MKAEIVVAAAQAETRAAAARSIRLAGAVASIPSVPGDAFAIRPRRRIFDTCLVGSASAVVAHAAAGTDQIRGGVAAGHELVVDDDGAFHPPGADGGLGTRLAGVGGLAHGRVRGRNRVARRDVRI